MLAIVGGGIAMTLNFIAENALSDGRLLIVLPEYTTLEFGLFAISPYRNLLIKSVAITHNG